MSRAAKTARALVQWREKAARLVVQALWCYECNDGELFDVTRVRAYCEAIIADSERRAQEREVFADWTRARGLGPENRYAFAERVGVWRVRIDRPAPGLWTIAGKREAEHFADDGDDARSVALGLGGAWGSRRPGDGEFAVYSQAPISVGLPAGGRCTVDEVEHFWMGRGRGLSVGGWPGPLAREWGTVECGACGGRGRVTRLANKRAAGVAFMLDDGSVSRSYTAKVERVRCEPCRGRGRVPRPGRRTDAAAGPGLARTAQRLLDTLDGRCPWAPSAEAQPSECQARHDYVSRTGVHYRTSHASPEPCPDCRGTGHNLAGVLPQIEWPTSIAVAVADSQRQRGSGPNRGEWTRRLYDSDAALMRAVNDIPEPGEHRAMGGPATRVVPRGEHRSTCEYPATQAELDAWHGRRQCPEWFATTAEYERACTEFELATSRLPRWRRGELRHADRERRRTGAGGA